MWIFGLYACMAFATLVIGHILSISEKPKEDLDTIIVIFSLISLMLNNIINYTRCAFRGIPFSVD